MDRFTQLINSLRSGDVRFVIIPRHCGSFSATSRPPEAFQVDRAAQVELHALGFEEHSLQLMRIAAAARADFAAGVDDAVPWDVRAAREVVQGVADLAGVSFESRKIRDGAVGRHAALRHSSDRGVDFLTICVHEWQSAQYLVAPNETTG